MCTNKEQAYITWQYGQKIDDAIKTEDVCTGFMNDPNPHTIFETKNKGNAPFKNIQQVTVFILDGGHTFEHYQKNTQYDNNKQHHIKKLPSLGIGFKYYFVEL